MGFGAVGGREAGGGAEVVEELEIPHVQVSRLINDDMVEGAIVTV